VGKRYEENKELAEGAGGGAGGGGGFGLGFLQKSPPMGEKGVRKFVEMGERGKPCRNRVKGTARCWGTQIRLKLSGKIKKHRELWGRQKGGMSGGEKVIRRGR